MVIPGICCTDTSTVHSPAMERLTSARYCPGDGPGTALKSAGIGMAVMSTCTETAAPESGLPPSVTLMINWFSPTAGGAGSEASITTKRPAGAEAGVARAPVLAKARRPTRTISRRLISFALIYTVTDRGPQAHSNRSWL